MERNEHAIKNGGSLKVVERKLGIVKNQMYPIRGNKEGNVATNMATIIKVAEDFCRDQYTNRNNLEDDERVNSPAELDINQ